MRNERLVQQRARDRLFAAELAEVLGAPVREEVGAAAAPQPWNWLAAALVLFGVCVASGVAWLRAREALTEAQQPRGFDAVDPWYEHEPPWDAGGRRYVGHEAELPAVPSTTTDLAVDARRPPLLAAVIERPGVRRLHLVRNPRELDRATWQALGRMPDLEALILQPPLQVVAADLRELRAAPKLASLTISSEGTFDTELAAAVVELPRLAMLALHRMELNAGGIAALSGLPHLERLFLDEVALDGDAAAALATLRGLRLLHVAGAGERATALLPAQVAPLAKLPRLEVLFLQNLQLEDAALAALPAQLRSLELPLLPDVTAAGFRALRRLTQLRSLSCSVPEAADARSALVEVLGALPLEHCRVHLRGAALDSAVWGALQRLPNLRRLDVGSRHDLADVVARSAQLRSLVRLTLRCPELPAPEVLRPLVGHPRLRRLELSLANGPIRVAAEPIAALRAVLGPGVELVVE